MSHDTKLNLEQFEARIEHFQESGEKWDVDFEELDTLELITFHTVLSAGIFHMANNDASEAQLEIAQSITQRLYDETPEFTEAVEDAFDGAKPGELSDNIPGSKWDFDFLTPWNVAFAIILIQGGIAIGEIGSVIAGFGWQVPAEVLSLTTVTTISLVSFHLGRNY